eukprot:jgi/Phyca11/574670/estExt2_Genewise1.C_PHYCAscaffold_640217
MRLGSAEEVCVRGVLPRVHVLFWCEEMLTLRGVSTTLCRNWREGALRLVVRCTCGFRAMCFCAVPSAVRFVLDISGESFHFRVEPDLIWGVYAAYGGDSTPMCAASCSNQSLLVMFSDVAVEVRIVFCLCTKGSRLLMMTYVCVCEWSSGCLRMCAVLLFLCWGRRVYSASSFV